VSSIISIVAMVGGVGAVVHFMIKGVRYIAGKTKTKVDDEVADVLEAAEPVLVEIGKEATGLPKAAPRPTTVDHRK
jgi:hypothetical protein